VDDLLNLSFRITQAGEHRKEFAVLGRVRAEAAVGRAGAREQRFVPCHAPVVLDFREDLPGFQDRVEVHRAGGEEILLFLVVVLVDLDDRAFAQHLPDLLRVQPLGIIRLRDQVHEPVQFDHAVDVEVAEQEPLDGVDHILFVLPQDLIHVRGDQVQDFRLEPDFPDVLVRAVALDDLDRLDDARIVRVVQREDAAAGAHEVAQQQDIPLRQPSEPVQRVVGQVVGERVEQFRLAGRERVVQVEEFEYLRQVPFDAGGKGVVKQFADVHGSIWSCQR